MNDNINYTQQDAIKKFKELVKETSLCLFSTNLQHEHAANTRPMSAYVSDKDDFIWFFSDKNSNKNKELSKGGFVQLYFADNSKSTYFSVAGKAMIVLGDKEKIKELWNPLLKTWFKDGVDDTNISLIKITPEDGYYWDAKGNRVSNLIKMATSVVTGKNLVENEEGKLNFK